MAILTAKAVEAKLRKLRGNMAAVGRAFGVSRSAVWKFVQDRPSLQAVVRDCREAMKDEAEASLYNAVLAGESWAVCFYLKTQAKDRGYVEQMNLGRAKAEELTDDELAAIATGGGGRIAPSPGPHPHERNGSG